MSYTLRKIGQAKGAEPLFPPWTIHRQIKNGTVQFGIEYNSEIYDGVNLEHKPISGLLENYQDSDDAGWENAQVGFVYIKGTILDSVVTAIDVNWGEDNKSNINRVLSVDGEQTEFSWIIGYIYKYTDDDGDDVWYLRQECNRNLTLLYVIVNGVLCKVPFEM